MNRILSRLDSIHEKIANAAQKAGRSAEDIKLVAVTKTIPVELIEQAIQAGITDIGENRVQEALPKIAALKQKYPQVTWHMLGHLQTNKVRQALGGFDIIQSLDSERLGREIEAQTSNLPAGRHGLKLQKQVPVLVEVNTSGEASKYGVSPEETVELVRRVSGFENIKIQGLMTIGLLSANIDEVRPCFKKLKELYEKIKNLNLPNVEMRYLSMGMTDDYATAIEEGSNMIRIGRGIFKGV